MTKGGTTVIAIAALFFGFFSGMAKFIVLVSAGILPLVSFTSYWHRRHWIVIGAAILLIMCSFSPFDISIENRPGPPKIYEVWYGLPSKEMMDKCSKRDDVTLGGCMVSSGSPRWILKW